MLYLASSRSLGCWHTTAVQASSGTIGFTIELSQGFIRGGGGGGKLPPQKRKKERGEEREKEREREREREREGEREREIVQYYSLGVLEEEEKIIEERERRTQYAARVDATPIFYP